MHKLLNQVHKVPSQFVNRFHIEDAKTSSIYMSILTTLDKDEYGKDVTVNNIKIWLVVYLKINKRDATFSYAYEFALNFISKSLI